MFRKIKNIIIVILLSFKICFSQSDSILKYQPCSYDSINFNQFIRKYNEIELPITFSKKYIKSISKKLGTKKYELISKQHRCFLPGFNFREGDMYANFNGINCFNIGKVKKDSIYYYFYIQSLKYFGSILPKSKHKFNYVIRFVRFNQNGKVNENYFYYKDLAELLHNKLLTKSNIDKDFNIEIMKKQENFIFKKWKKVK